MNSYETPKFKNANCFSLMFCHVYCFLVSKTNQLNDIRYYVGIESDRKLNAEHEDLLTMIKIFSEKVS